MKCYTGINTTALFNKLFRLINLFYLIRFIGRDPSMQKTLAKSGIKDVILLRNRVSVMRFCSH